MVLASVVWRSVQYRVVASRVESQAHRLCSPAALSTPPRRHWLSRFLFFATFANRPSPSRQTRSHSARPCPLREAPTLARSNCASVSVCRPARAPLSLSLSVSVCVCERASVCVCVSTCSGCVWTTTFFEILFHVVVSTDGRCWFIEFGAATAVVCVLLLPRNQERRKTSASVHKNNHHRRPGHGERAIRDDRVGFGSSTRIRFD